jgi:hypothetical protein
MFNENEVRDWWNALTPDRRTATAKELKLWTPEADWSVAWSELRVNALRENLLRELQTALPDQ